MLQRNFGKTGWNVSVLGFGAWAIGGEWGAQTDSDSRAALRAAVESGVNFIDTAAGYGNGHSERLIRDLLKEHRDKGIRVATKTPPAPGPWPPSPVCRWQDRYPAAYLRDNIEQRLKNLGVDALDVLQLHTWTRAWNDDPQPLLVLQKLREEGKVRWVGLSTPEHDQDCVVQLMRDGLVDVVQVIFNIFHQEPLAQIFPVAEETGTAVIVRVPLDEGGLTEKYPSDHVFPENDFRSRYFAGDRWGRVSQRVTELRRDLTALGVPKTTTLAEIALRYARFPRAVSTVIAGMRHAQQVRENVAAMAAPELDPSVIAALSRHNWRRGIWYAGK